jgi:hypothetical protein
VKEYGDQDSCLIQDEPEGRDRDAGD